VAKTEQSDQANVGPVIWRYRKMNGLTQQELADRIDVSRAHVARMEMGGAKGRSPSEKLARRIARALEMPPSLLLVPMGAYDQEIVTLAWARAIEEAGEPDSPDWQEDREFLFSRALDDIQGQRDYWRNPDRSASAPSDPKAAYYADHGPQRWSALSAEDKHTAQAFVDFLLSRKPEA
jgi:transcriptional regulator with XRE-family HTH domain